MRLARRAINILRREGPITLFYKSVSFTKGKAGSVQQAANSLRTVLFSKTRPEEDTYTIVLRESNIDSDTISIISELAKKETVPTVYLACADKEKFEKMNGYIAEYLRKNGVNVHIIEKDTQTYVGKILSSKVVISDNPNRTIIIRYFDHNNNRKYVSIDHGPVTKANAQHRSGRSYRRPCSLIPSIKSKFRRKLDIKTVASEVYKYYILSGRPNPWEDVEEYVTYGYPRFDRLRRLKEGSEESILPAEVKEDLEKDDHFNILYAPTHHPYTRNPFPLDGSVSDLRSYLKSNSIRLYVRMHIQEEENGIYDDLIDGDTICYAGHHSSPASTELLPYFDALATDFSSIYMEFLLFDRPILFFDKNYEQFEEEYGLGFNYDDWFPGKKITTVDEFSDHLNDLINGQDKFSDDRNFVRRAFLSQGSERRLNTSFELIEKHN